MRFGGDRSRAEPRRRARWPWLLVFVVFLWVACSTLVVQCGGVDLEHAGGELIGEQQGDAAISYDIRVSVAGAALEVGDAALRAGLRSSRARRRAWVGASSVDFDAARLEGSLPLLVKVDEGELRTKRDDRRGTVRLEGHVKLRHCPLLVLCYTRKEYVLYLVRDYRGRSRAGVDELD